MYLFTIKKASFDCFFVQVPVKVLLLNVQKFASRLVTYDCPVIASAVADPDLELHVREGGRGQFPK